jgi:myo-inositol catabolism protein IolS
MRYRKMGKTDLKVSEIGFGTWAIGGPARLGPKEIGWGDVDDEVALRTLEACTDLGINFIDTADVYGGGHSEELIGKVFKNRRSDVVICSKGGNVNFSESGFVKDFSREWIKKVCEESLKRLKTDYIDVYLYHTPRGDMRYIPEEFETLDELKQEGKIRYGGVSIGPAEDGLKLLDCGCGEVVELAYSILQRDAEGELLPGCQGEKVGVIIREPLCSGFLTGKFTPDVTFPTNDIRSSLPREAIAQRVEVVERLRSLFADSSRTLAQLALQFCLSSQAVSVVIPGAKTPEQLRENANASELGPLTSEELTSIDELFPPSA